jgi:hypothetical protein
LGEERPLSTPIVLAEWMDRIDLREVVRHAVHKGHPRQTPEELLSGELPEDVPGVRLDMLRKAEHVGLCDRDCADFAGPRIEPAEDPFVKGL